MKKRKLVLGAIVLSSLLVSVGCEQNKAEGQEKNIAIEEVKIEEFNMSVSKIDVYENRIGQDWIDENKILVTRENLDLESINIDNSNIKGDFEVKNIYEYDLNSNKEKGIGDQSKFQNGAISSQGNKYVFYMNEFEKNPTGYIADSTGNTKVKIMDKNIDEYDLSEASWIDDKALIMPSHKIRGFAIINIDGSIDTIKNVEKGTMGTKDPLNGLSITNPTKVGDKIYYVTIHRGFDDHNKLKVYDIKEKEHKELVKDFVQEFKLSPNKEQIIMLTSNFEKDVNELIISDLDGNQRGVLAEGYIFAPIWSHDGSKVAYISNEEGKEGLYVVDIKTKKSILISEGEYYAPISWSPSNKKIMIHGAVSKDKNRPFDQIDTTNVITIK